MKHEILIADDHPFMLEGLKNVLQLHFPSSKIHTAENKRILDTILSLTSVDILIQDVKFGTEDARLFLDEYLVKYPEMKIIVLSSVADSDSIQKVLKMGVHGYIIKSEATELLKIAIETVFQEEQFLSPEVGQILSKELLQQSKNQVYLTAREKDVLREIMDEKSIKEIAKTLFISEKTVEHHRANLFMKLEVKNSTGLVKKTIELKLLDL